MIVLAILDGWGQSRKNIGNPIEQAAKPFLDKIEREFPMTFLQASGLAVGLTWSETGNSEVGHLNIGAGRIVEQYNLRISRDIESGRFYENPVLNEVFDSALARGGKVHMVGLLTSGTVHASFAHLTALLEIAGRKKFSETYLHLFTDGRDSGLREAGSLLAKLKQQIARIGFGKIATIVGRDLAMDRNNNWDKTKQAYDLLANAEGETGDLETILNNYYRADQTDPAMPPAFDSASGFSGITAADSVMFFNFREDSMRQLVRTFIDIDFKNFERRVVPFPAYAGNGTTRPDNDSGQPYVTAMTEYLESPLLHIAYAPPKINNGLAEVLSNSGRKQFHIAETEKYAHVTYFFNGLKNSAFKDEEDFFVKSVKTPIQQPAMRSPEIADRVVDEIKRGYFDFIVINFANPDLLSHTGNYDATLAGIEAIDSAIGRISEQILAKDGFLLITSDHGHAEEMVYGATGEQRTEHNNNPVPFYLISNKFRKAVPGKPDKINVPVDGILADVAPTILELMSISQPAEMTGQSLLGIMNLE